MTVSRTSDGRLPRFWDLKPHPAPPGDRHVPPRCEDEAAWRSKLQLTEILPSGFGEVLDSLRAFTDPILTGSATDTATWVPV